MIIFSGPCNGLPVKSIAFLWDKCSNNCVEWLLNFSPRIGQENLECHSPKPREPDGNRSPTGVLGNSWVRACAEAKEPRTAQPSPAKKKNKTKQKKNPKTKVEEIARIIQKAIASNKKAAQVTCTLSLHPFYRFF